MAANKEIAREVSALPQWAQVTGASAWLIGRSFSKVVRHSAQRYS